MVEAQMSRSQLTSTDQQNSGGPVAPFVAGKNKIINGDFYINQRGFSSTSTNTTYGFDRWSIFLSGGPVTYSAQTFTAGSAPVAGYESTNFARIVTSQSGTSDFAFLSQPIEDVRTFAGQTVTLSFWARSSSGTPNVGFHFNQTFGSGGSSDVLTSAGVTAITTSWARYSKTVTLPSIAGQTIGTGSYLRACVFTSAGTSISGAGYPAVGAQSATIDIWGVQVERGSVATPFTTATGTIQGELAACEYYYQTKVWNGLKSPSNYCWLAIPLNRRMRTTPSISYNDSQGNQSRIYILNSTGTATFNINTIVVSGNDPASAIIVTNNTDSYYQFGLILMASAEL
jgi:hypothetical protein